MGGRSTPTWASITRKAVALSPEILPGRLDELWESARHEVGVVDVVDLFSGCGGMSAGFTALNALLPAYRIIGAADVDKTANATYEANLSVKPSSEDVARLAHRRRPLDFAGPRDPNRPLVLIGCAPCQGFSSHRNAEGASDERNSLFVDFAMIAARAQPDAIVAENVPELLTDRYWPHVESAVARLRRAGYYVQLSVHNVAEFGVPQERFRALLFAMKRPFRPLRGVVPRTQYRTVRSAIGKLPRVTAGARLESDPMHYSAGHKESTLRTIRAVPPNGGSRPKDVGPDCLRRAHERQGRGAYDDVYGRLHWDRPSITITAYARNPASGRYVHPDQDRGLTVREAALLQGFPRSYWFAGSFDDGFRQIGNAVPPPFAAAVGAHVLGELASDPPQEMEAGITSPIGPSFSRLIPALKAGHRSLG